MVSRLKDRADFLNARDGARSHERAFVLQLRQRGEPDDAGLRVGYTVTKKIGNSVERNRIKRRLREAVKLADIPEHCHDKDAVLIARRVALTCSFESLVNAVNHGMRHAKFGQKSGNKGNRSNRRVANQH